MCNQSLIDWLRNIDARLVLSAQKGEWNKDWDKLISYTCNDKKSDFAKYARFVAWGNRRYTVHCNVESLSVSFLRYFVSPCSNVKCLEGVLPSSLIRRLAVCPVLYTGHVPDLSSCCPALAMAYRPTTPSFQEEKKYIYTMETDGKMVKRLRVVN